ncbi:MAG TPA: selenium-dependent molybdenum cofactor biosynthesis protein YqeB, partial [Thermodesulfobacteriota bacterium]
RGGGEMATGVVHRLVRSGFRVCITEIPEPHAVRREVAFCEAVFDCQKEVEGITARRVGDEKEVRGAWDEGMIPLQVDPECKIREVLKPQVLVDAIMAKRNVGTRMGDAPLVIGLGPGFRAGADVHLVVETNRGHNLGRVIEDGEAEPDTGVPGEIGGYTWERVLRSPGNGRLLGSKKIGDPVKKGEVIARVGGAVVEAGIEGILRGILRDGLPVHQGMKVGDIDPRGIRAHCFTISDKARAIGGGVLEAILMGYDQL